MNILRTTSAEGHPVEAHVQTFLLEADTQQPRGFRGTLRFQSPTDGWVEETGEYDLHGFRYYQHGSTEVADFYEFTV